MTVDGPPLRDASTVVLVRDGEDGLEVFLQRRAGAMSFAPGMTVFPGGGVDPSDADTRPGWIGPSTQTWGEVLGVEPDRARMLVVAAVRETFEECGVLLATADERPVTDTGSFAEARRAIESREITFADFLVERGLSVRTDLLRPRANWITPEGQTRRRYDTRFFVAALPNGQAADDATTEADDAYWSTPAAALADFAAGRRLLLPPTWSVLVGLERAHTVTEALGMPADMSPVQGVLHRVDGALRLDFDGSDRYYATMPG